MIATFEREPVGWVHPFYRCNRQRQAQPILGDWGDFIRPALETVSTLNHMLQLAHHEPQFNQPSTSQSDNRQQRDRFEVKMDVQQFAPEELNVKMVDNCVVVEGKHEEKMDEHGFISRNFVRRYQLPEDVKPETVVCNLNSDGILCISAPRMIEEKPVSERTVPINFTGQPAAVKIKQEGKAVKTDDKEQVENFEKMER